VTRPSVGLAVGSADRIAVELAAGIEASAHDLGLPAGWAADPREAADRDVLIGVGYPDYYPWLSRPLAGTTRVSWLGEPLPPADDPAVARLRRSLPMGRILDVVSTPYRLAGRRSPPRLADARERAAFDHDRRINLASHVRGARTGIRLVVTSQDRVASLRRAGVASLAVPFGYHAVHAGPAKPVDDAERDIDVLVLATDAAGVPTRRARVLRAVIAELGPGCRVEVIERDSFGAERHRQLARAKIVLNVHRAPGNFTGIRTLLVGAAGALLVSEPVATPEPFVPGLHYVEARPDDLASAVRTALADRARRLEVAEALQRFLVDELTMPRALATVLDATA
jgi:hypothetical protein